MNPYLTAVDDLDDRGIAGCIRQRQVHGRRFVAGHTGRHELIATLRDVGDGLIDGGEVVEVVLRPQRQREAGLLEVAFAVIGFRQPQQIGDEAFLVDAVAGRHIINGGGDAAVFRRPAQFIGIATPARAADAAREGPEVGFHVLGPIHIAPGDDRLAVVGPEHARTGGGKIGAEQRHDHGGDAAEHSESPIASRHPLLSTGDINERPRRGPP